VIGRWKRYENHFPPEDNLIHDSEKNEENGYKIQYSNKAKINDTKGPNDAHKNTLKEEILQLNTESFMEI
jgi:hypothetical protein